MKDVLLFSGGLDSLIAWFYLDRPKALYVPLGHRYEQDELQSVLQLRAMLDMPVEIGPDLPLGQWEQEDAFIPLRNLFLAAIGSYYGDRIWLALQKGETDLADRSPNFTQRLSKMLQALWGDRQKTVDSPFWHLTKAQMVGWFLEQGYSPELLFLTHSCYTPVNGMACGVCSACFRRWVALEVNGLEEPYASPPWSGPLVARYLERIRRGELDFDRAKEIYTALKRHNIEE